MGWGENDRFLLNILKVKIRWLFSPEDTTFLEKLLVAIDTQDPVTSVLSEHLNKDRTKL